MIDGQIMLLAEENSMFTVWILRNWNTIQHWAAQATIPAHYLAKIVQSRGWGIVNILKRADNPRRVIKTVG